MGILSKVFGTEHHRAQNESVLARARFLLIEELGQSALLHEAGRYDDLGAKFDEIDGLLWSVKPRKVREMSLEYSAYCFLGSWLDASNHDWFFNEPVSEGDWPSLARCMKEVLEGRRDFRPEDYRGVLQ